MRLFCGTNVPVYVKHVSLVAKDRSTSLLSFDLHQIIYGYDFLQVHAGNPETHHDPIVADIQPSQVATSLYTFQRRYVVVSEA